MALLYRTTTITVNTITLTVTHSLSQTPANVFTVVTDRNATGHVYVVGVQTNAILLRATVDASLCDLEIGTWHSIQGGPSGG